MASLKSMSASIVPSPAAIEKLAGGFQFTEGPVWTDAGYLLFSDIPRNAICKWTPGGQVEIFREPSGWDGSGAPEGALVGSNGLTLDRERRLLICEHGNRRVSRLEPDGQLTVLAASYEGKRLNSPNDIVCRSDGSIYFTDPPYGLAGRDEDPAKELPYSGVYRLAPDGSLTLLYRELARPNGLAFSPDERYLYVSNSEPERRIWMRFEVAADGSIGNGAVFFDATARQDPGNPDGMKLDREGNLYCTGPGGIWILSPDARHLGTITAPEIPANLAWGDPDGRTLYITARTGLYRVRLNVPGIRP
jgi:gluconolactonase